MDDRTVIETMNDYEMMQRPHLWPHGSVLPVKRWVDGEMETGLMWRSEGGVKPQVMLKNLFEKLTEKTKVVEYESFEELLADGWVVD